MVLEAIWTQETGNWGWSVPNGMGGAFWRLHWAPFPGSRCSRAFSHYKRCGRRAAPSGCHVQNVHHSGLVHNRAHATSPAAPPAAVRTAEQLEEAQSTIIVVAPEPGAVVTSTKPVPIVAEPAKPEPVAVEHTIQQPHAPTGWLIQIGAFDSEAEARQHLSEAQFQASAVLATADPSPKVCKEVTNCSTERASPASIRVSGNRLQATQAP